MGTDGAWRWRKGVEDKYHYRFWGQVVRWMAYQRNMVKGETMRLYYSPDQPRRDRRWRFMRTWWSVAASRFPKATLRRESSRRPGRRKRCGLPPAVRNGASIKAA